MIERHGRTKGVYYVLSKSYYEYAGKEGEYTRQAGWTAEQAASLILQHLGSFPRAKMGAFEAALQGHMTRRQVKVVVDQLVRNGDLLKQGKGPGTYYEISPQFIEKQKLLVEVVELGIKALNQSQGNVQDLSKKEAPES